MATIGSLTADLRLESAAFIRDLKKAADATARNTSAMQRQMAGLQRGFTAAGNSFKAFAAGFVSIAAVRQLAALGSQAIQTADDIGAAATKIGISAEELQKFRFAAELADVSTESLDNALRLFAQNLAKGKIAAEGNNISEAFQNYIQTIADAPTQLEKVRIAQEAFGKQWQTAMLLAAQGSEEFKRQFDNAFARTDETIRLAGELDNQLKALNNAVSVGFDTGFIVGFSKELEGAEKNLNDINAAAEKFGMLVGQSIGQAISAFQKLNDFADQNFGWLADILNSATGIENQAPALPELKFWGDADPAKIQATTDALGEGVNVAKEAALAAREAADAQQAWLDRLEAGAPIFEATRGPFEAMRIELEDLSRLYQQDSETFGRAQTMAAASAIQPWLNVASTIGGALGQLFEDNKAVAIAQAIINTAQGVTAALAQYPPPLSFAMAAAQAAAGAVQIATMKSSKPGTGGSVRKPSAGGGSGKRVEASSSSSSGSSAQDRAVFVNLQGTGRYSREEVFGLIEQLVEAQKDGARLILSNP